MANKIKPITPGEVSKKKEESIPDEVFASFNELIAKNWDGRDATVAQADVVKLIASKMQIETGEIFDKNWLDVESLYRKSGWKVVYDKPGYNESYEAFFRFTKK